MSEGEEPTAEIPVSTEAMLIRSTAAFCATALLGLLCACATAGADEPATAADAAIWQKHVYSFAYLGFTSRYSCDGLADKLRTLLIAAGARPDVKSQAGACASGFGRPDRFARADLTFYALAPGATDGAALGPAVAARWVSVALAAHRPQDLSTGDCELVEQFRSSVLPLFTTRDVENHTTCVPHQLSGSVIDLKFQSLSAAAPTAHAR